MSRPYQGNDLTDVIIRQIRQTGPIPVAEYMRLALYHPEHGYYVKARPIGAEGDFITAPEVSQMFGELLGLWCVQTWLDLGSPGRFNLVECGPGRGTLMQDALRAASKHTGFLKAATICLIETSETLRQEQQRAFSDHDNVRWHASLDDVSTAPLILLANEFFDCLPIRQYVRRKDGWHERLVQAGPDGRLLFCLGPTAAPLTQTGETDPIANENDVLEVCDLADGIVNRIADLLRARPGRALIIDYGYDRPRTGDTLQSLRQHDHHDVLTSPGSADLTAHVNFPQLVKLAQRYSLSVAGPVSQCRFLSNLGIEIRAQQLKSSATAVQAEAIDAAMQRLCSPEEMGELFKAVCFSSQGLPEPAGMD